MSDENIFKKHEHDFSPHTRAETKPLTVEQIEKCLTDDVAINPSWDKHRCAQAIHAAMLSESARIRELEEEIEKQHTTFAVLAKRAMEQHEEIDTLKSNQAELMEFLKRDILDALIDLQNYIENSGWTRSRQAELDDVKRIIAEIEEK
jgi:hypothetical protein